MRRLPLAEALRVKRPCRLPWDGLTPVSDDVRHCETCGKEVHDISALTYAEAEALVRSDETRERGLCGRIERRTSDGAIRLADGYAFPENARASRKALTVAATVASFGLAACATQPAPVPELVSPPFVSGAPLAAPAPKPTPKEPTPEPPELGLAAPPEPTPEPEPPPSPPIAAKPVLQAGKPSAAKPQPAAKGGKKKPKHEVILGDMY